jgi:hypothetical protein
MSENRGVGFDDGVSCGGEMGLEKRVDLVRQAS